MRMGEYWRFLLFSSVSVLMALQGTEVVTCLKPMSRRWRLGLGFTWHLHTFFSALGSIHACIHSLIRSLLSSISNCYEKGFICSFSSNCSALRNQLVFFGVVVRFSFCLRANVFIHFTSRRCASSSPCPDSIQPS